MKSDIPKWALDIDSSSIIDYIAYTLNQLEINFEVCIRKDMQKFMNYPYFLQDEIYSESYGPIASKDIFINEDYLIVNADMPFINKKDLKEFIENFKQVNADIGIMVTKKVSDKSNYQKVYNKKNLKFNCGYLYNLGIYLIRGELLNEQKEFYKDEFDLTLPSFLEKVKKETYLYEVESSKDYLNINTKENLEEARLYLKEKLRNEISKVNNLIAKNFDIDFFSTVRGSDIYENVKIRKSTVINSIIKENTHIINSIIKTGNYLGPFLKIEDSNVLNNNEIGSFVEIKRSDIGSNNQIKHHAYLGDVIMKDRNNIGAMMVVSNFNGAYKNKTYVGSDNFIGSFTNLVSPLEIGSNNYIASMTKITETVFNNQFIKERHQNIILENTFNQKDYLI